MLVQQWKAKPLPDRRQQENNLHHREVVADTLPWSTAKRKVRVPRQRLNRLTRPTLRHKLIRALEETGIAMRDPLKRKQLRPTRHTIPAHLGVLDRLAPNRVSRRIQPHRFLRDHLRELQFRQIRNLRRT